jgi:methyl-accepting chemotaxis protein
MGLVMISSLRTRILVICSATVVGALALSGGVTYGIVRSNMMDSITENLAAIASSNTLTIVQWVKSKQRAVNETAEIVEPGDPQRYVAQMARVGGFGVATAGWLDKTFFSTNKTPAGYDPTTRPWYTTAMAKGHPVVTQPYPDASPHIPYVSFAAPTLRDGHAIGVVSGAVTLDGIRDVVNAVHPTPSSLAFVVSEDGQIIAHPDTALTLKPSTAVASDLTADALAQLVDQHGLRAVDIGGASKLLKVQAVSGTNWYLVVALDEHEATAGLRDMLRAMTAALISLTLAAVGIAAWFTSKSFRRLGKVRDAMAVIGSGTGDLTHRLQVVGNDEITQIATAFNGFVDKIGALLMQVRINVEAMKAATAEIEAGNRDLSHRTELSASSLQETSAALTELTASIRTSVDASTQASRLTSLTSEVARRGGVAMSQVVATMDEISRSSASITEIIGVIDGIAFQTNILALNAAVEAARAGNNGRGFAVVAAEVRSLAQRSAKAAAEIKNLIGVSTTNVQAGAQTVNAAGATISEVVKEIESVNRIIVEIEGSMNEQSVGISQIDRSVAEMDRATQQNAALVEQSSAASSLLNERAQGLVDVVGLFRLRETAEQNV